MASRYDTAPEHTPVVPVYLVLDWSEHMGLVIDRINTLVTGVLDHFRHDPVLCNRVRMTIIYFNDEAVDDLNWGDMAVEWPEVPIRARGPKSYQEAVWKVVEELARHTDRTADHGVAVMDPLVFVVTSDAPDQGPDWSDALDWFGTQVVWNPLVECFVHTTGAGPATVCQLQRWASRGRVHTYDDPDAFVQAVSGSVTASASASVEAGATVLVPPGAR